ncbi:molybdenum cofactor guanylyltransferase MobA [Polycladidibacter hongkongensis]|uniref:molybdenum cofactor guanylyltransferase MobA n=1 Tax=Polycladidibacter hongkongensis TaxID=1647556 RepID=UPI000833CA17|nr:molybdenum cofactor guanylyltransferase MobA [Pseudovibrio hongkongensis]
MAQPSPAAPSARPDKAREKTLGCVLSGGLSRRMLGADKGAQLLEGRPLVAHVATRLSAQVDALVISSNAPTTAHVELNLPILPDIMPGHLGPLSGILTALDYATQNGFSQVLVGATDTPFFPTHLLEKLATQADQQTAKVCVAASGARLHPTFSLWATCLRTPLSSYLQAGERRLMGFINAQAHAICHFPLMEAEGRQLDPFFNINSPEDLAGASEDAALWAALDDEANA